MDKKELKKLLAGIGIAGLISGGGVAATSGSAFGGSGWGAKDDSAVGTVKEVKSGGSGWSGHTDSAVGAEEEKENQAEEMHEDAEKKMPEKKAGSSGW